jgi:hypothetical protein
MLTVELWEPLCWQKISKGTMKGKVYYLIQNIQKFKIFNANVNGLM